MSEQQSEIRYVIVEDNAESRKRLIRLFDELGWILVSQLSSKQEAFDYSDGLEISTVQVALVDANLDPAGQDGFDGIAVMAAFKEAHPKIITVGISLEPGKPYGNEYYLGKAPSFEDLESLQKFVQSRLRT